MPFTRTFQIPLAGVLFAALCAALAGCSEPGAPPLDNAPPPPSAPSAAANAPAPAGEPASGKPIGVEMVTSMGTIELELDPGKAPDTVKNFVGYVKKGFYDGTIFHRVISDFMIQGGGFTKDLQEKPTEAPIKNEGQNGLHNERGTIAMARTSDPDSATAQFFINVADNTGKLDYPNPDGHGYAVFGKVTKGMDVVDEIKNVSTSNGPNGMGDVPVKTVTIKSVKLKEPAASGGA